MAGKRSINCEDNLIHTRIAAQINNINTATIVEVLAVDAINKRVRVQPMVQMYDLKNQAINHAEVNDIPYARLQGGTYGIICDPVVGDIGVVVFCSRDISNVKENKKVTLPASKRSYSLSDGIYIASLLLDEPKTFIKITDGNIEIKAPTIQITGNITVNGSITATEDIKSGNISLQNHIHGNGNNGGNTTKPVG